MDRARWTESAVANRGQGSGARVLRGDGPSGHHAASSSRSATDPRCRGAARRRLSARRRSLHGDRPARPHCDVAPRHPPPARRRHRPPAVAHPRPRIGSRRSKGCTGSRCIPEKQFAAKNLVLKAVDFELRLPAGEVFIAETPEGVTAMVLLGEGTMVFQPAPKEERGQLRLFAGVEALETPFTAAFVRLSPFEFDQRVDRRHARTGRRSTAAPTAAASACSTKSVPKSFNLDLSDLSRDTWSLLPQPGDFVAEVKTRRFDDLTYARSSGEAEDVTMFQRRTEAQHLRVYLRAEAAEPRPLLRRRRQRRLRRARLRHRRARSIPSASGWRAARG